jgi:hypothetical protein
MSKLACPCGGIISDTLVPCPTEGWIWILRDQNQEGYQEAVGRDIASYFAAIRAGRRDAWLGEFFSPQYPAEVGGVEVVTDIIGVRGRQFTLSIAECERCGRLHVQREPGINSYLTFAPDEPGYAGVLRSRVAKNDEPGAAADGGA